MKTVVVAKVLSYCKSENFSENFIFANSVKRHIAALKIRDLPISVSDSDFPRILKPSRKFPNLQ